jgi:hypothetical protein
MLASCKRATWISRDLSLSQIQSCGLIAEEPQVEGDSEAQLLERRHVRFNLANAAVIGATLICWSGAALTDPLSGTGQTVFGDAPIGHLQPRSPEFLSNSAAEQAEQKRESDFDAKEKKQEMEFDRKLNICRCGEEKPPKR